MTGLVLAEVGVVEVPIEERLILLLQTAEKRLLNLLQKIEAHEDIGVVFKGDGFVEGDLTVEGAFVGETLSGEDIVILLVDVADMAPELQEALLKLGGVVIGEVAEELADDVLLFRGEEGTVVELVDVAYVGEDPIGGRHVLIDVVEVAQ